LLVVSKYTPRRDALKARTNEPSPHHRHRRRCGRRCHPGQQINVPLLYYGQF
jgi:hypothetical protein